MSFEASLQCLIEEKIRNQAKEIGDQMLCDYNKKMHQKISETVSALSIEILRMVRMERSGNDLIITVRIDDK